MIVVKLFITYSLAFVLLNIRLLSFHLKTEMAGPLLLKRQVRSRHCNDKRTREERRFIGSYCVSHCADAESKQKPASSLPDAAIRHCCVCPSRVPATFIWTPQSRGHAAPSSRRPFGDARLRLAVPRLLLGQACSVPISGVTVDVNDAAVKVSNEKAARDAPLLVKDEEEAKEEVHQFCHECLYYVCDDDWRRRWQPMRL